NSNNRIGFDLYGCNETINGLFTGSGSGTNVLFNGSNSITSTLTIGDNDAAGTWGGIIEDTDGTFWPSGTGKTAITKIGGGVQVFTNINTYSGVTTISNGVLQLIGQATIPNSRFDIKGGKLDVSSIT